MSAETLSILFSFHINKIVFTKMSKGIPTAFFYGSKSSHIRITNNGIMQEERKTAVFVPDGCSSDIEDECDGEIEEIMNENVNKEPYGEEMEIGSDKDFDDRVEGYDKNDGGDDNPGDDAIEYDGNVVNELLREQ